MSHFDYSGSTLIVTGDEDEEGRVQDLDYDFFDEWFSDGLGMTLTAE